MKAEALKDFLNSLSDGIEKDNIELFRKIIDSSEIKDFSNPEEFFFAVQYPWENFISGFLSTITENQHVKMIFKNYHFIDRHLCALFEKHEGSACSADKSRTIINRLLNFYSTGKIIEFNYEVEYTYHLPKKILTNHKDIINFCEGLRNLLHGKPDKYIEALKIFQSTMKQTE